MAIAVSCSCGRTLKVRDELNGKRIRCPDCSSPVRVSDGRADAEAAPTTVRPRTSKAKNTGPKIKSAPAANRQRPARKQKTQRSARRRPEPQMDPWAETEDDGPEDYDDAWSEPRTAKKRRKAKRGSGSTKKIVGAVAVGALLITLIIVRIATRTNLGNLKWQARAMGVTCDGPAMGTEDGSIRLPSEWTSIIAGARDGRFQIGWQLVDGNTMQRSYFSVIEGSQYEASMRPIDSSTGSIDPSKVNGNADDLLASIDTSLGDVKYLVETGELAGMVFTRVSWVSKLNIRCVSYVGYTSGRKVIFLGAHSGPTTEKCTPATFDAIAQTFSINVSDAFIPATATSAADYSDTKSIPRIASNEARADEILRLNFQDHYGREPSDEELAEYRKKIEDPSE